MSVKGSMIAADKTDFKVNIDWKQQVFETIGLTLTYIVVIGGLISGLWHS